jgi:hypothetical protein
MPEDKETTQELIVNEAAPAYLSAKKNTALLEAEEEAPKPRFVLSPDKYTGGVPDEGKMTEDELVALVEDGFAQIEAGMCSPADEVWERLRKKHSWKL